MGGTRLAIKQKLAQSGKGFLFLLRGKRWLKFMTSVLVAGVRTFPPPPHRYAFVRLISQDPEIPEAPFHVC